MMRPFILTCRTWKQKYSPLAFVLLAVLLLASTITGYTPRWMFNNRDGRASHVVTIDTHTNYEMRWYHNKQQSGSTKLRLATKPSSLCMKIFDDDLTCRTDTTAATGKQATQVRSMDRRAVLAQAVSTTSAAVAASLIACKYSEVQPVYAAAVTVDEVTDDMSLSSTNTMSESQVQKKTTNEQPKGGKTNSAVICDSTISAWTISNDDGRSSSSGSTVFLLGTAHISEVSAELAGALIRQVHPDAVFVELDQKRVQNLPTIASAASSSEATITSTIKTDGSPVSGSIDVKYTGKPAILVPSIVRSTDSSITSSSSTPSMDGQQSTSRNWLQQKMLNAAGVAVGKGIQSMYSNLNSAGFQPGEEFAEAIRAGREIDATIVLGDQDVRITLRRLAEALSMTDFNKLMDPDSKLEQTMSNLLPSLPPSLDGGTSNTGSDPTQLKRDLSEYVEKMKSRETVRTIINELNEIAPNIVRVMLTERDLYMATGINTLQQSYPSVVAVMGLAHIDGVERNLSKFGWKPVLLPCPR